VKHAAIGIGAVGEVGDGGEDASRVYRELRILVGVPDAAIADVDEKDAAWAVLAARAGSVGRGSKNYALT
jgi:hypothetical protein